MLIGSPSETRSPFSPPVTATTHDRFFGKDNRGNWRDGGGFSPWICLTYGVSFQVNQVRLTTSDPSAARPSRSNVSPFEYVGFRGRVKPRSLASETLTIRFPSAFLPLSCSSYGEDVPGSFECPRGASCRGGPTRRTRVNQCQSKDSHRWVMRSITWFRVVIRARSRVDFASDWRPWAAPS
jgi:hypothetical protein